MRSRAGWWCLVSIGLAAACGKAESDVFKDPALGGGSSGGGRGGSGGRIGQGGQPIDPPTGGRVARGGAANGGSQAGGDVNGGEPAGGASDAGGEASGGNTSSGGSASGGNTSSGGSASGGKGSGGTSGGSGASGAGTPGTGGTSGAGNQDDPAAPLANAFCAAARDCCDDAGLGTAALSDCEAQLQVQLLNFDLTSEGLLEVDPSALQACVAAFEAARTSCVLTGLLSLCRRVWHGTKQDGEPCTDVSQCDRTGGPKVCLRNLETVSQSDPGVCADVPHGQNGQACSQSCAEGADCSTNFSSFEAEPVTTLCHEADGIYCAFADDAATCAPLTTRGSPCDSSSQCAAADFCDSTCQRRSSGGEACQFSFGCSADLLCTNGECVDTPLATAELCAGNLGSSGLN